MGAPLRGELKGAGIIMLALVPPAFSTHQEAVLAADASENC
jgi:hypothetical protein